MLIEVEIAMQEQAENFNEETESCFFFKCQMEIIRLKSAISELNNSTEEFNKEEVIKTFSDKPKLREFITTHYKKG